MDPDMVRQQEEAEIASRSPRPGQEPFQRSAMAQPAASYYPSAPHSYHSPSGGAPPQRTEPIQRGVWFTALLATFLTVLGLSQGLKFGVALSLVPWQALSAGALAAFIAGWGGTALWLRFRHRLSSGRAAAAAFLPAVMVMIIMKAAFKLADRYWTLVPINIAELLDHYEAGVLIVSAGALAAYLLAFYRLRKSLRR